MPDSESLFLDYRFAREYQYAWLEYYAYIQATLVGGTSIVVQKGLLDNLFSGASNLFGRLRKRKHFKGPTINIGVGPEQGIPLSQEIDGLQEWEQAAFDWLQDDFNEVYTSEAYKGSVIGMIADEFLRQGIDLNQLKSMSLEDMDNEMKSTGYPKGLSDLDDYLDRNGIKQSSYYAALWNQDQGANWLAVYDENGNRSGRSYEVVRDMVRGIVQHSIEEDISIDELRQRLIYADSEEAKSILRKPDGSLDEEAYQEFFLTHLNRDMVRVAVTETSYAFNNGKILRALHEGSNYLQYSF